MPQIREGLLHPARRLLAIALVCLVAACARSPGPFVWVDAYTPPPEPAEGYRIRVGDLLSFSVWDHPEMSVRTRVREDGRVSFALIGDLQAATETPESLARALESALLQRNLIVGPRVTVSVEESRGLSIAVLGEVARPGLYQLAMGSGVAQALASAGGFTDFGKRDRIFVVRQAATPQRIRFTYEALTQARGSASAFRLREGDVVVVE